jgi:hypothetical protein
MTAADFQRSLAQAAPPEQTALPLQALWWAAKGDWARAHRLVQDDPSPEAAWVHAYLHRVEGDLGNAGYWYRRAGRAAASGPAEAEWREITEKLIDRRGIARR